MRFDEVREAVAGVPHMSVKQARTIYDFILTEKPRDLLELGFAHGVSSCYVAAALDELGSGHLTTVDKSNCLDRTPTIYDLLDRCGLRDRVTPVVCETSYTWELMAMLERDPRPAFDFVYIDGAHTWDVDGFAFLLTDRFVRPGGWVLFDDLDWTLDSSPSLRNYDWVRALPEQQRKTPQVRKVFELLVRTHPDYTDFRDEGGWGWARKRRGAALHLPRWWGRRSA